jgi:hypothetical protein
LLEKLALFFSPAARIRSQPAHGPCGFGFALRDTASPGLCTFPAPGHNSVKRENAMVL